MRTKHEQDLMTMFQMGVQKGLSLAYQQKTQVLTPTCPLHVGTPLWTETEPKPDGSWLYCVFCRQNQQTNRETEHIQTVQQRVRGLHKHNLVYTNTDWLNSDVSEEETHMMPVVENPT